MAKRCIGIDISPYYLHAMQICQSGNEFIIEKVFSMQTRRSTERPAQILRSLFSQHGFDRRAEASISVPHDAVFFHNMQLQPAELEQIKAHGSSILEYHFPVKPDDAITKIYACRQVKKENFSVLAAATSRKALHERLSLLAEARIYPELIDAPVSAIYSVVLINYPDVAIGAAIIACIDNYYMTLAVTEDGHILAVRNIPVIQGSGSDTASVIEQVAAQLSHEIEITWKKVSGTDRLEGEDKIVSESNGQSDIQINTSDSQRIYLVMKGDIFEPLKALIEKELLSNVVIVDPYVKVNIPVEYKADPSSYIIAEGLGLRVLAPDKTYGVNFLEADNANKKPEFDLRKELVIVATLFVVIAIFWVVGLFIRLSGLEANYERLKIQINDVFHSTLPEEQNIVSPLAQLEQRIASFGNDYQLFASFYLDSSSPLNVLHDITASIPPQVDVKVNDLFIAADMVQITGTCDSFESVYKWQHQLKELPGFGEVEVKDIQRQPQSGAVGFIMILSAADK